MHRSRPAAMMAQPEQLARQYYDALNRRRHDDVAKLIDRNTGFHLPDQRAHLFGNVGYAEIADWWVVAFPDLELTVRSLMLNEGHLVLADLICRGTHTHPLPVGRFTLPATGLVEEFTFREELDIRDGRITDVWLFVDLDQRAVQRLVHLPDPHDSLVRPSFNITPGYMGSGIGHPLEYMGGLARERGF